MKKRKKTTYAKPDETDFEAHFCTQLDINGNYKVRYGADIKRLIINDVHFGDLEEFLRTTQKETLRQFKTEHGSDWKTVFQKGLEMALQTQVFYELLKDGIEIGDYHFTLVYFPPQRSGNTAQQVLYEKNRFMAVRQWYFGTITKNKSIDIVLLINGFPVITIELKNQGTSGTCDDAVQQYLDREEELQLPIFQRPFLHIACGNRKAKIATTFSEPPNEKDFRDFNEDLVNMAEKIIGYKVNYLYHDILLPHRILNFIEFYLERKNSGWIFPRFHQQRATQTVVTDIKKQFQATKTLNLRYLIQHSTGSGKSKTIVWMAQNLRNAYVGNDKLFDSVVILTDRLNLDNQISTDFRNAILTEGIAAYAETTQGLRKALHANKKVIVSTIHKFSHLQALSDQTGKRICIIIDEAHRSQEGKLHENVTGTFKKKQKQKKGKAVELAETYAPLDSQEQMLVKIEKKTFPNLAFIALTGTPSDRTLNHFGKKVTNKETGKVEYVPHDVYSMEQAIAEGYIMDVSKHIYQYNTLYELNKEIDTKNEYPQLIVQKALRKKVYEDDDIINDKCQRMLTIFERESAYKMRGRAKAMIVASSRMAAVKYRLMLDKIIKSRGLPYKALTAFSGKIKHKGEIYREKTMNKVHNPKGLKLEELFETTDDIRFLIVANKFQTGFDEPMLHTMFLDKSLRDRTAVQTLSRLNRIHPDKEDTLVVDFTGSYEQIMRAYKKYQKNVATFKGVQPHHLELLRVKLLGYGVFNRALVEEIAELIRTRKSTNISTIVGLLDSINKAVKEMPNEKDRNDFKTLVGRYVDLYNYISALYDITDVKLQNFQLFADFLRGRLSGMDYRELKKELEAVQIVNFRIPKAVQEPIVEYEPTSGGGADVDPTTVNRTTKTIQEIIEEINQQFQKQLGDTGIVIVGAFYRKIAQDEELKNIVKNNLDKDEERVYEEVLKSKLKSQLIDTIIEKDPSKYLMIMDDKVRPTIKRVAFKVLKNAIRA